MNCILLSDYIKLSKQEKLTQNFVLLSKFNPYATASYKFVPQYCNFDRYEELRDNYSIEKQTRLKEIISNQFKNKNVIFIVEFPNLQKIISNI